MIKLFHLYFLGLIIFLSHSTLTTMNSNKDLTARVLFDERPKVFDCFVFSEQSDIDFLKLKIKVMSEFVDFFIISQAQRTASGQDKPLTFRKTWFGDLSNKIIYLPVRNFPGGSSAPSPNNIQDLQFVQNSVDGVLRTMAEADDLIILSKDDELINQQTIQYFLQQKPQIASVVHSLLYIYWDQMLEDSQKAPLHYEGTKILTYSQLNQVYHKNMYQLRRDKMPTALKIDKGAVKYILQKNKDSVFGQIGLIQTFELKTIVLDDPLLLPVIAQSIQKEGNKSIYAKKLLMFEDQLDVGQKESEEVRTQQPKPVFTSPRRLVFDCFLYNGQEHLLSLHLKITGKFADYFLINEGAYTITGMKKELFFNISKFPEYMDRIIYLPLHNLPFRYKGLSDKQIWPNQFYMRDTHINVLNIVARPEDVIVLGDVDQMMTREGLLTFDPVRDKVAITELRLFHFYFNRRTVHHAGNRIIPTGWYSGTRVSTFQTLLSPRFDGNMSIFRQFSQGTIQRVLLQSGWHFSFVLGDSGLQYKMRSWAHSPSADFTIHDYKRARQHIWVPNSFHQDIGIMNELLPEQLRADISQKRQKSEYWKYFSEQKYKWIQQFRPLTQEEEQQLRWFNENYHDQVYQPARQGCQSEYLSIALAAILVTIFIDILIRKIYQKVTKSRQSLSNKIGDEQMSEDSKQKSQRMEDVDTIGS